MVEGLHMTENAQIVHFQGTALKILNSASYNFQLIRLFGRNEYCNVLPTGPCLLCSQTQTENKRTQFPFNMKHTDLFILQEQQLIQCSLTKLIIWSV